MAGQPFGILHIPSHLVTAMIDHAQHEAPLECCGLLAGVIEPAGADMPMGRVVERYPLINEAASPVAFLSEPRSMFEAMRTMRTGGLDVLAVYHSHPASLPVPSRTDLARNYSPAVVNLIISLATTPPTVRGWWLTDHDYREAEWTVLASKGTCS